MFNVSQATTPATAPFFSFEDAGIRRAIIEFASDWGDAQAAEDYHAGNVADPDSLMYQGEQEAQKVLARGDARTDDASSFVYTFSHAWADGYTDRIVFAEMRGW